MIPKTENFSSRPRLAQFFFTAISLLFIQQPATAGTLSQIGYDRWVTAEKVFDGDTFSTTEGEKVRLLGINTPETAHDSQPAEPYGRKATEFLKSLIEGKQLRLLLDRDHRDRYGRLLAQAYLRDGRWANGLLVEAGLAHVYTFAPNFKWADKLVAIEKTARANQLGIWNQDYFRVLDAAKVDRSHIGRYRLVKGVVHEVGNWSFRLNDLHISIPRSYREWFEKSPKISKGQQWLVRGKIRISNSGKLYLALHSPFDMEKVE